MQAGRLPQPGEANPLSIASFLWVYGMLLGGWAGEREGERERWKGGKKEGGRKEHGKV